ncbi:Bug family tripartite tricarboxylate transporter substrate binding protein [Pseudoroseomonas globiformis]|uniref:Bug family tripartite tricarboxylate transporter substrate binding protein n=1 Tax=Teichococcus globiformis TaxID=2307229 RepID=A0ABV7FXD3_9PROT
MLRRHLGALALAGSLPAIGLSRKARAQAYPSRPIRMISPFPPGGGTDLLARALCTRLAEAKGWTVVVENRAGANGAIGLAEAARAPTEGYDIVLGQQDNLVLAPLLTKVAFDPVKDFAPVAFAVQSPPVITVATQSPYKSFADLVKAAKAAPGSLAFGSSGSGSSSHIISEMLRLHGGIQLQHVPYRGSNPAMADLMGGHVAAVGSSIASASSALQSGAARPLAVAGVTRSSSLPDTPTLRELGYDVEMTTWWGVLGPARMPQMVTELLNKEFNQLMSQPELIRVLAQQGMEPAPSTPAAFAELIRKDVETCRAIINQIGMKLD